MPQQRLVEFTSLVLLLTLILGPAASQFDADNAGLSDAEAMSIIFCNEELIKSVPSQLQLLQSLQTQMTSSGREMGELKRPIAALEVQVTNQSSSMERLLQLREHVTEFNQKLNSKVDNLQAKMGEIKPKIVALEGIISTYGSRMGQVTTAMAALDTKVNSQSLRVGELKTTITALDTKVNSQNSKMSELKTTIAALDTKINSQNSKMGELKTTVAALEAKVTSQSSNMERVLKLLNQISESNEKLNSKVDNLHTKFERTLNSIDSNLESTKERSSFAPGLSSASLVRELPSSCAEALDGPDAKSGVYTLYLPDSGLPPFRVYCLLDPDGGPGWTVVQRRINGTTDFYRRWQEYKEGFGDVHAEYFIGLDRLHALTNPPQELWVSLKDFNETAYAIYDRFTIGSENDKYRLKGLGEYSGTAGSSLRYQIREKFSTWDNDNDNRDNGNCAATFKGAWWYDSCHTSNLNGLYLPGKLSEDQYAIAITWKTFRGEYYGLHYAHMAIRPRTSDD